MSHHDQLIQLARQMIDRNPAAPSEGELMRAVSTAYYGLFHLLIAKATGLLVAAPHLRSRVARTFEHKWMNQVCEEYGNAIEINPGEYRTKKAGVVITAGLYRIANTFEALQLHRHAADYDLEVDVDYDSASIDVQRVETAFADWKTIEGTPAADAFLAEFWCRGIPKRN